MYEKRSAIRCSRNDNACLNGMSNKIKMITVSDMKKSMKSYIVLEKQKFYAIIIHNMQEAH